ncbi:hypothetical protein ACLQ2R_29700 [Streptosporangium sp. DT93]|uniref:hypothetical protein n=1 Tax=Streptosporangium sp. DT93 TaxID=3393428 RepID=UPI003CEA458B
MAEVMRKAGKLSREVRFSARQIRRWESADPPYPRPAHRRVLQEYFKRSPVELGFTPAVPPPDGTTLTAVSRTAAGRHDTRAGALSHRRGFAVNAATSTAAVPGPPPWTAPAASLDSDGPRVGIDEVELLKATARDHDAIDQRLGSEVLWRTAHAHLGLVRYLYEQGTYSDAIGEELTLIAGRLTTSLGWYAYDADRQAEARVHLSEGLNAAMLDDDTSLATRTLTVLARQAIDLGAPREAVRFARSAHRRALTWRTRPYARTAPPRVMALIAIREAHGHAAGGDEAAFESAVKQAWTAFERGTADDDPYWIAFLNEAELTCLEGMARADAHQHRRAVRLLERAGRDQSAEFTRNRGMSLVRLAGATLACGEVDHAVAAGQETMNLMDRGLSSARIRRRLSSLAGDLVAHAASPPVRDLRARLAEVTVRP